MIIGLLIAVVALFLACEAKGLLIGEAADSALVLRLRRAATRPGVMGIGEIMTIHNTPEQTVAALNVVFENRLTAGDVERIVVEIEQVVQAEFPSVTRVNIYVPKRMRASSSGPSADGSRCRVGCLYPSARGEP